MSSSRLLERPLRAINYYSKAKILAPMVRIGTLPFRITSQHCGADVLYSEELVDKKLLLTTRCINEELNIVEYRDEKNESRVVFSTSPDLEPNPLVLQIGTSNADLAVRVAEKMYPDYDAIDVNCGCPKHFSVHSGMGAKLLQDRDNLLKILSSLVRAVGSHGKAVTCKIRLLKDINETIDLVKAIEQTGVNAIAVHARYVPQRPRESAHLPLLAKLKEAVQIPLIANGDCFTYDDIETIKEVTKCDSVMIARGAMWNPAIFSDNADLRNEWRDPHVRALFMLNIFERLDNNFGNTKYIITRMYSDEVKDGKFNVKLYQTTNLKAMRQVIHEQMDLEKARQPIRLTTDKIDYFNKM